MPRDALSARNRIEEDILKHTLAESFLVRLLADGMDDRSTLHRLFDEQLDGKNFAEAENIVWIVSSAAIDPHTVSVEVISSGYWLDALRDCKSFESSAYSDVSMGAVTNGQD